MSERRGEHLLICRGCHRWWIEIDGAEAGDRCQCTCAPGDDRYEEWEVMPTEPTNCQEHVISGPLSSASCSCGWFTSSESEGDVWRDILEHERSARPASPPEAPTTTSHSGGDAR